MFVVVKRYSIVQCKVIIISNPITVKTLIFGYLAVRLGFWQLSQTWNQVELYQSFTLNVLSQYSHWIWFSMDWLSVLICFFLVILVGEYTLVCCVGSQGIIMSFNPGQALESEIVSPASWTDGNLLVEAVSWAKSLKMSWKGSLFMSFVKKVLRFPMLHWVVMVVMILLVTKMSKLVRGWIGGWKEVLTYGLLLGLLLLPWNFDCETFTRSRFVF